VHADPCPGNGAHKVIIGTSAFTSGGIDAEFLRTLLAGVPREQLTIEEEINALEEMGMNAALGMAIYQKLFPEPLKKQAGRSKSL
jgi:hypothetical protein